MNSVLKKLCFLLKRNRFRFPGGVFLDTITHFCMRVCLFIHSPVSLSICQSVYLSVGPSVSLAMSPRSNIVYFFHQIFSVEFDFFIFLMGMKNCKIYETFIHVHFNPYILILSKFFEALSSLMHLKCSVSYIGSKTLTRRIQ